MTAFPPEIIARIKDDTDIVELVGRYVPLRPAGSGYKGLCPFHREKTPSFTVNPTRQSYKCFGCGEGGDAIAFLMAVEGIAFPEAVETLARTLDIDLAQFLQAGSDEGEKRAFFRANEMAVSAFREAFQDERRGQPSREYLDDRGFAPEILDRYDVGFAPAGDWLPRWLAKAGVSEELAVSAGLVRRGDRGGSFAYFRDRIIFPIRNIARQVAGFGGRVLGPGEPKYLNSSDSPYFTKGKLLYGFDASRMVIARSKTAVLVEGYLDLMALAQIGIANVVATCGTSFTVDQARLLRRGARKVVMLFDGDFAGRKAAVKSSHLALSAGLEAEVASLPAGVDPCDLAMQGGAEAVREVLDAAVPYLHFLHDAVVAAGDDRFAREKGARQALTTVAAVSDPMRRELMLQETAELFGLPPEVARATLAGMATGLRPVVATAEDEASEDEVASTVARPRPPQFRTFTTVRREVVEAELFAHVLRDTTGQAASRFLAERGELTFMTPAATVLVGELEVWASESAHSTTLGPADFVQQRWHVQDASYRRWVTDLLERPEYYPAEGDFDRAVRESLERLHQARAFDRG